MQLSEEDLAELTSRGEAVHRRFTRALCRECQTVLPKRAEGWANPNMACSACGRGGLRNDWPPYLALDTLRSAFYLFGRGEDRKEGSKAGVAAAAPRVLGREVDEADVGRALRKLREEAAAEDDPVMAAARALEIIGDEFGLTLADDHEAAYDVFELINLGYEEYKTVLMLVSAFVDALFDAVLERGICIRTGKPYKVAHQTVESYRSDPEREAVFRALSGKRFRKELRRLSPSWCTRYQRIRSLRNRFVHGSLEEINRSVAVEALKAGVEAIDLFAELHNMCAAEAGEDDA